MNETITNATAGAAITSPWWVPALDSAHVFQDLGAVWLLVQIASTIYKTWIKTDK